MSETVYTHVASEETLRRIANALELSAGLGVLQWDETNGEYTPQSVAALLYAGNDSLPYGVSIPKGSATACTKIGANAGIAAPTPGIVGRAAIDPYVGRGPFRKYEVNGYVDEDGAPHVTAVEKDGRFKRDGSNGDVWILAPTLYWLIDESDDDAVTISVSDTKLSGMEPQPQAYLPDGTLRPFMLYAKYVGVRGEDGYMHSYSGYAPWAWGPSHNTLITECRNASTGYSGKSFGDDWYVKVMFLLKYANKNSQSIFTGCANYNYQYNPAVAETGVTRVILTTAQAANLIVGSSMMLGTHTASSTDRGQSYNHDVFGNLKILSIETYDDTHSAVYLDSATTFDTETTYLFSTAPWQSGVLDALEGDGTITDAGRTNSHEPFKIQGIETMMGLYETLGDVMVYSDGSSGWELCVNYDSRNEATSLTSDYTHTGKYLASGTADAWHYPLYPENAGGLLFGASEGASSSTGLADGSYANKTETTGAHEFLGLGNLYTGAGAGLWFVYAGYGLTSASWYIGGRLSAIGRSREAA